MYWEGNAEWKIEFYELLYSGEQALSPNFYGKRLLGTSNNWDILTDCVWRKKGKI
jgi:hypothetical protein